MAAADAAAVIRSCTALRWLGAPEVRESGALRSMTHVTASMDVSAGHAAAPYKPRHCHDACDQRQSKMFTADPHAGWCAAALQMAKTSLLSAGAEATLFRLFAARQAFGGLPSLHSLSVGWGFGCAALQALASGSRFLTELSAGIGAEVSDWLLVCLATACPHLKALRLHFSTVTDRGVLFTRGLTLCSSCLGSAVCLKQGILPSAGQHADGS